MDGTFPRHPDEARVPGNREEATDVGVVRGFLYAQNFKTRVVSRNSMGMTSVAEVIVSYSI